MKRVTSRAAKKTHPHAGDSKNVTAAAKSAMAMVSTSDLGIVFHCPFGAWWLGCSSRLGCSSIRSFSHMLDRTATGAFRHSGVILAREVFNLRKATRPKSKPADLDFERIE